MLRPAMYEQKLVLFESSLPYRFCQAQWARGLTPVPLDKLLGQVSGIDVAKCQRLVFAGGSPLAHPDFERVVAACRDAGLAHFSLETDGMSLAREGAVEHLVSLGFEQVSVVVGGIREKVYEFVMQETGAFREAMQGIRKASLSALKLYLVVPVLRANAEDIAPLLEWTLQLGGHLDGFLLALPEIDHVPVTHRKLLLKAGEQAQLAAKVFRACQGNRVEYGFATKRGITPCATEGALDRFGTVFHERFNYFKHQPNERLSRVSACDGCSLIHSCQGVESEYVRTFGEAEFKPVPLEVSSNWKLRRFNLLERFEYRNVSPFKNDAPVDPRGLLRINGHCNMSCAFCFVDRTAPDFEADGLMAEIDRMAAGGTKHLVLSGGEPTLHPQLPDLIAHARTKGFNTIEMQSNGVKAADESYARTLVDAGLTKVTFSLHSVNPEKSDEITRLPKAFWKTLQAMHHFRRMGVLTQIAHVITKENYKELPETVRFLRKEFPENEGHLSICFAIAQGISDLVFHWVIPTFAEIKPYFKNALDFCLETGVGFGGMIGQGGYPPCMLDGDLRYYAAVLDKVFKSDDADQQFYKSAKCAECDFNTRCLGPRRSYVDHYGDAELVPFKIPGGLPQVASRPGAREDDAVLHLT